MYELVEPGLFPINRGLYYYLTWK